MNEKFFNTALGNFSFIVIELAQVNPDNSLGECVNLQLNYEAKPRGFRPDKTRAASFLIGFKNIPEKAWVNRFHNNYAFVNVGNFHTRKTF